MSLNTVQFDEVIKKIKEDEKAYRIGWGVPGKYISVHKPTKEEKVRKEYIAVWSPYSEFTPWTPTALDLLADDWVVGDPVRDD